MVLDHQLLLKKTIFLWNFLHIKYQKSIFWKEFIIFLEKIKRIFIDFFSSLISRMLQREPEVRASLEDIVNDTWLIEDTDG